MNAQQEQLDWGSLGFGYIQTDYNVRCYWRDGKWGEWEVSSSDMITIPMASTCLHYGQESFEGLKAFRGKDGKVRVFRPEENAKRMQSTSQGILMPELPTERFLEAVDMLLHLNKRFIPPYESGASLYIRPLMIGLGKQVGVKPSNEYMVGGNYAASLRSGELAHSMGYSAVIYLDAKEKLYIDECGPANFFGIRDNTYITPKSSSILPSITNKSLMQLAEDMGLRVECRPVHVEELETFEEAGACGTAAVISPIERVDDLDLKKSYIISKDGQPGPISKQLYERLRAIQYGDYPDTHGWVRIYPDID